MTDEAITIEQRGSKFCAVHLVDGYPVEATEVFDTEDALIDMMLSGRAGWSQRVEATTAWIHANVGVTGR